MDDQHPFCPDTIMPFSGYRTPRQDNKGFIRGGPEFCASVAHFYFSERARGVDDARRREILQLPAASEARKAAQRITATQAWLDARLDIVRCALWLQFLSVPSLAKRILAGEVPIGSGQSLGQGWEARRRGDERWRQAVMKVAAQFVAEDRMALLASGDTDLFNPFLFSSRIDALLNGKMPQTVVVACRAGVDAMSEFWAIGKHLPVVHVPLRTHPSSKVSTDAIEQLCAQASHAILFSKGEDSTVQAIGLAMARLARPIRTVKLDHDGRPLPKKTQPPRSRR